MKFVRFSVGSDPIIHSGTAADGQIKEIEGNIFGHWQYTGKSFAMNEVSLKAPLQPRNIIGIGQNYVAEGEAKPPVPELPIFFYKPLSALAGPEEPIKMPLGLEEIKFESELAVVIGREARHIAPEQADACIFGYTVANDVAAPQYFHPNGHWTIGKAFDTFCPLGPVIETELDRESIRVKASVNGEAVQDGKLDLMIMPIDRMIAYISGFMTLLPGDVILTGTPAGAGMVQSGDVIECRIDEIGVLRNRVVKDQG